MSQLKMFQCNVIGDTVHSSRFFCFIKQQCVLKYYVTSCNQPFDANNTNICYDVMCTFTYITQLLLTFKSFPHIRYTPYGITIQWALIGSDVCLLSCALFVMEILGRANVLKSVMRSVNQISASHAFPALCFRQYKILQACQG